MKNLFKLDPDAPEKKVDAAAQKLFEKSTKRWTPGFPWVAVRILKRSQTTKGGLILPEHVQNKTILEGIVMRTWEPIWALHPRQLMNIERLASYIDKDAAITDYSVRYKSSLKPGDHVLFPHWAGLPMAGVNEERYRIVKEENWSPSVEGGIFAKVEYSVEEQAAADDKVIEWLRGAYGPLLPKEAAPDFDQLLELLKTRYILVPKEGQSVTLSGV